MSDALKPTPPMRRCPGEKYDITLPICHGRQLKNYPKCAACPEREKDQAQPESGIPPASLAAFKAYDIRGRYPEVVNEPLFERVASAVVKFLGATSLLVSHDMRASSRPLADAVIQGITRMGCDVIDAGLASTDANYFAIGQYETNGGMQITASHNPPSDNGMKISREKAMPIGQDSGLENIKHLAQGRLRPAPRRGKVVRKDLRDEFARHVLACARLVPRIKVVLDAGNGMMGHMLPPILERLPIESVPMYFELDGTFPNHEANPLKVETLRDLQARVVAEKADLGVAFDADGDRCGFVDEQGRVVPGDLVVALIARSVLRRQKGPIVYDVRCSRVVDEVVRELGGVPVRERVGHAFMKATMRTRNAAFGGELSCHYYFRENFFTDSGALALVHMLNVLGEEQKPLSELLRPLRKYFATGEINFVVADKEAKMSELIRTFPDGRTDRKDGITIEYPDWWFNVRPSNTEPLLRLNLEAATEALMREKQGLLTRLLGR